MTSPGKWQRRGIRNLCVKRLKRILNSAQNVPLLQQVCVVRCILSFLLEMSDTYLSVNFSYNFFYTACRNLTCYFVNNFLEYVMLFHF